MQKKKKCKLISKYQNKPLECANSTLKIQAGILYVFTFYSISVGDNLWVPANTHLEKGRYTVCDGGNVSSLDDVSVSP